MDSPQEQTDKQVEEQNKIVLAAVNAIISEE